VAPSVSQWENRRVEAEGFFVTPSVSQWENRRVKAEGF